MNKPELNTQNKQLELISELQGQMEIVTGLLVTAFERIELLEAIITPK